jgi:multidrug efflux pump
VLTITEPGTARLLVGFPPDAETTAKAIRDAIGTVPGVHVGVIDLKTRVRRPRATPPIRLELLGPDRAELARWADGTVEDLKQHPAVVDPSVNHRTRVRHLRVLVDRAKATAMGVDEKHVLDVAAVATGAEIVLRGVGRVRVGIPGPKGASAFDRLIVRNTDGHLIPLPALALVQTVEASVVLERTDGRPSIAVTATQGADTHGGLAAMSVRAMAERLRQQIGLPDTYTVKER